MANGTRLDGKILAVAGGGGIGDAVAERLAAQGATVILGDLAADRAEQTAARLREKGLSITAGRLDGSDAASVTEFFAAIERDHAGLDGILINFASFADAASDADVLGLPIEVFDEVMGVNARGYVLVTQAALPLLLARGGGAVVYMSSGSAHDGAPIRTAYAMSKAAVNALMRHVASAFGDRGVRTNAIAPGYIMHEALRAAAPELEALGIEEAVYKPRTGETKDIAGLVELLMSDEGEIITGQVLSVDGGITMRP